MTGSNYPQRAPGEVLRELLGRRGLQPPAQLRLGTGNCSRRKRSLGGRREGSFARRLYPEKAAETELYGPQGRHLYTGAQGIREFLDKKKLTDRS